MIDIRHIKGDFDQKIKLYNPEPMFMKLWKYRNYICIIKNNSAIGIHCCYVVVDARLMEDHLEDFSVHGGITMDGELWMGHNFETVQAIGFDYGHCDDFCSVRPNGNVTPIQSKVKETESLVDQIISIL